MTEAGDDNGRFSLLLIGLSKGVEKGSLEDLEEILKEPDVTPFTWLNNNIKNTLETICKCQDGEQRRRLLARYAEAYPAGHPIWEKSIFAAANKADVETLQWFVAHGASLNTHDHATPAGRHLLVHAAMRDDAQGEAVFKYILATVPDALVRDALNQAWSSAVLTVRPFMMRVIVEHGVHPLTPLDAGSYPGAVGTPDNTADRSLLRHMKSYTMRGQEEAWRLLDEKGGLDWERKNRCGNTLAEEMRDCRGEWPEEKNFFVTFLRWQRGWQHEAMTRVVKDVRTTQTIPRARL